MPKNVGGWFPRTPSLPPSPFNLFSPPSLRFHRPVRSYQAVPTFFLSPCPFFFTPCIFIWFVVRPGNWKKKKKKRTGRYALSSLGFFLLLLSRHLPVSSTSRACGTPPHAVLFLLRGAVLRSVFCRVEWPRARRSFRIWRYHRGRMAGYAPKSKNRLAFFQALHGWARRVWCHYLARGRQGKRGIVLCVPVRPTSTFFFFFLVSSRKKE